MMGSNDGHITGLESACGIPVEHACVFDDDYDDGYFDGAADDTKPLRCAMSV